MLAFDFDLDFHFADHGEHGHPGALGSHTPHSRELDLDLDLDGPH